MERYDTYPIEHVEMLFQNANSRYVEFDKIEVSVKSQRYSLFMKNKTCVSCGVIGTYYAAERHIKNGPRYHFNLYGTNELGQEVLITKDHIIPKSKGGKNHLNNYQTMCIVCNMKKANN